VDVPDGGDNYKEGIVIHKALVGDPGDPGNYPGSILVNVPILKVHALTTLTNAIKNLGIGGWPICAGHDDDVRTPDWKYSYPPDVHPGMKAGVPGWKEDGVWKGHGVFHQRWYVVDADDEGMTLEITDTPNLGLDGTMVDMNLAIKSQVPYILHVVDAVKVIDLEHWGTGPGLSREEGLIFASEDPVALDLLCARYMFKNLPRGLISPDLFARGVPVPRYDETSGAIVTDPGVDSRLSRSTLFDYAAGRGLGKLKYHVLGVDKTTRPPRPLISKDGHFGRIERGKFVEIMTDESYFHMQSSLWHLQPTVLAYAKATDQLPGSTSNYYEEFMALDEDGDGMIDDSESGTNGGFECGLAAYGIAVNLMGKGEVNHGIFFQYSRTLKYADPSWNSGSGEWLRVVVDNFAVPVALQMATGPDTDEEGNPNIDPFFGIQYGTGADGVPKWPSLQFARYGLELSLIYDIMYANAKAYSEATGKAFTFYVPAFPPPPYYNPYGLPHVVETTDPTLVFTVRFDDGEVW